MKYIRTKWTIFEVVEENDVVYKVKAKGKPNHIYSKSKCQTDVIKEADTIEELCDEFVCLENKMMFIHLETITSSCNLKHLTVFGAIWTDKGLIYAAKMNEKEELELL